MKTKIKIFTVLSLDVKLISLFTFLHKCTPYRHVGVDTRHVGVDTRHVGIDTRHQVAMLGHFDIIMLLQMVIHHWKNMLLRYITISVTWLYVN